MNNPSYNQTLAELEKSLGDLGSARNQVESVAAKSETVIEAFTQVLNSIKNFEDGANLDKGTFAERLNQSYSQLEKQLSDFNSDIDSQIKELKKSNDQLTTQIKEEVKESKENLKTELGKFTGAVETHVDELKQSNDNLSSQIHQEVEEKKENLKSELSSFTSSVEIKKTELDKYLKELQTALGNRMTEVGASFNALKSEIEKTEQRISEVDFKSEFTSISNLVSRAEQTLNSSIQGTSNELNMKLESRVADLEVKLKKASMTNLIVLGIGMVVIIVLTLIR